MTNENKKQSQTGETKKWQAHLAAQAEFRRVISSGCAADLTLVLPGNISIAIGDNFSGATLNRLLNVLTAR